MNEMKGGDASPVECVMCGESRWILNKDGKCIFCLHPKPMGVQVDRIIDTQQSGKKVSVEASVNQNFTI